MQKCDPNDIAIKSFFLGPGSENEKWVSEEVKILFENWYSWRKQLFTEDGKVITEEDQNNESFIAQQENFRQKLHELISSYESEVPHFSPHYIGHMVSETSLPGLFGHMATLLHNPNNISDEVSRVGASIEDEAIKDLNRMVGYDPEEGCGHFTSGGTVANIEALWRARYRLDHWLSLGAFHREQGNEQRGIVSLAMRGWEDFDSCRESHPVTDNVLRKYSFVASTPWEAVRTYDRIFEGEFKGPVVLVPNNKHYSWQKAVSLLGLGESAFWPVELTREGRLSIEDLKLKIEKAVADNRPVMMVVSVAGTTELGEVDPVHEVQDLLDTIRRERGWYIWHHVDGAYGGFFLSMLNGDSLPAKLSPLVNAALTAIRRADSVTIDPHKLGYVPYACGALLVQDSRHYLVSTFSAPYVGGNKKISRKEKTLEGSRAATGAAATWLSSKTIGFTPEGLGRVLSLTLQTKDNLKRHLQKEIPQCRFVSGDDLNVLCFSIAYQGESLSEVNERSTQVYERLPQDDGFFVSKTFMSFESYGPFLESYLEDWEAIRDQKGVMVVRIVLMNPFFSSKEYARNYEQAFITSLKNTLSQIEQVAEKSKEVIF